MPPRALTRLVEVADRHPEAGLIGPAIYRPGKGTLQSSFRPFPSWEAAFRHYTIAKPILRALPRRRWQPVIDSPTTSGAIRAGWKVLYTHKVSVFHHSRKSTSQERSSRMGFVGVESLLHYLDSESEKPSRALKPLFKLGYLLHLTCQIVASGAKVLGYSLARRAEKAAKHMGQFKRDADFLKRFTGQFLRL